MSSFTFKYQPLNETGQATTWLSQKGSFEGELLQLANASYEAKDILHTHLVENRFVFVTSSSDGELHAFPLLIHSGSAKQLKLEIDRVRSGYRVANAEEEWKKSGANSPFRREVCPNCQATLDLSRFDPTPQLFCDYCDTIYTSPKQRETPINESEYRLCEHCGMYSRPRPFTEFYFYFVIVLYGFWTNKSLRCPACMRGTAWKMLAMNFLFVLGVFPAIYQLIRAYSSDSMSGAFSGLHSANLKATKRQYSAATKIYQSILERVPVAAGIHYNLGLALTQNQEWERAAAAFELSLDDCSNYRYAVGGLMHCYETLGRADDLRALKLQWGQEEDAPTVEE